MDTTLAIQRVYSAPAGGNAFSDWRDYRREDYQLTPRQQSVVNVVADVLSAANLSHSALVAGCAVQFGVSISDALSHDCYMARGYLQFRAWLESDRLAWSRLGPTEGLPLGTLIFNDRKRTTGCCVAKIEMETRCVHVTGRHGRNAAEVRVAASALAAAMDLAKARGLRSTSFEEFLDSLELNRSRSASGSAPTACPVAPSRLPAVPRWGG